MQGILLPFNVRTANHGHDITLFASNPILPTFTEDGFCRSSTILTRIMGMLPWNKKLNAIINNLLSSTLYLKNVCRLYFTQLPCPIKTLFSVWCLASLVASRVPLLCSLPVHSISNCSALFMPVSLMILLCLCFVHHKGSRYFVFAAVHKIKELGKQGLMINWMRPLCVHTFVVVIS